ncbi:MAG: DUF2007 domain-containing protein [Flavobacteriales bacterium]
MKWTTIHTVTYPSEAHVIKLQLENEGINVFLKDELTVQTDNFISNAIGGVKIQVGSEDVDAAIQLLLKLGYKTEQNNKKETFLDKIYDFTSKIPLIKNLIPEFRLLTLVGISLLLILVPYFYYQPSIYNQITSKDWCVESLYFEGKFYEPNTVSYMNLRARGIGECLEKMKFAGDEVTLPGFETPEINAKFKIQSSNIVIYDADTLGEIFNGVYSVDISNGKFVMNSNKCSLISFKNNYELRMPNFNY